jgi:hypothetical protein
LDVVVRRRVVEVVGGTTARTGGLFRLLANVRDAVPVVPVGLVDVLEPRDDFVAVLVGGMPRLGTPMTPRLAVALAMPVGFGDFVAAGDAGAGEAWVAGGVSVGVSVGGVGIEGDAVSTSAMMNDDDFKSRYVVDYGSSQGIQ